MSRLPPVPATTPAQRFLAATCSLAKTLYTEDGPPSLDLLVEVSSDVTRLAGAEPAQENVQQQVKNLIECDLVKQVSAIAPDGEVELR